MCSFVSLEDVFAFTLVNFISPFDLRLQATKFYILLEMRYVGTLAGETMLLYRYTLIMIIHSLFNMTWIVPCPKIYILRL